MIELLVVLAIIGIVSGIALYSYNETNKKIILKDIHEVAKLFLVKSESCIRLAGKYYPCKINNEAQLKTILGITCPKHAKCTFAGRVHSTDNRMSNHCISITREIQGKKYQLVASMNSALNPVKKMRKNPKIFCKEGITSYITLTHHHCKSYVYVTYADDGSSYTEKADPGFKVCDWAKE